VDNDTLLTGDNAAFLDAQYEAWLNAPESVEPTWRELFETWGRPSNGSSWGRAEVRPRSIFRGGSRAPANDVDVLKVAERQAKVAQLINAYRVRGHTNAAIDPLEQLQRGDHPELTLEYYGLTESDLDATVSSRPLYGVPQFTTLRHIVERLERAYSSSFGVEFMNIGEPEKKRWLQQRVETLQDAPLLTKEEQLTVLTKLSDAEAFERFLHSRFPGTKRFSLEGAETFIPLTHLLLERLAEHGAKEVVFGMAHRGRLNFLCNIMQKSIGQLVAEFEDQPLAKFSGSGDVKYHLGFSSHFQAHDGAELYLSLAFNPSHLEAVDPVVEGRVRARQDRLADKERSRVVPVLVHGDAAFAGQGLVAEVLNLSELHGYRTGGTIHVIINNQIGFTTPPSDARSTPYATDIARMLAIPIFHVNGEDPEAVAAVVRLAADFRAAFHEDVVIDLYCYRLHGHNEGDEPSFTQPLLYEAIRSHPSPRVAYARRMLERGEIAQTEIDRIFNESKERIERSLNEAGDYDPYLGRIDSEVGRLWSNYKGSLADPVDTTVPAEKLRAIIVEANTVPEGMHAHRKIERLLAERREMATGNRPIDWAVAEQLAWGTLILEGTKVRISGQDTGRGTFSHRHAVLADIETGVEHVPLDRLAEGHARFVVVDSPLSEAAVLGFEYGFSLESPDALVHWEAQFGDFANGAQVIIDNFIITGEQKWARASGLVLLLPHGYEGQGPEHSSARLERFLELCAQDNMIVANCTTPASYYHLLRRQALMKVRKPLIVMSPKSLLRHPKVVSTVEELADGSFQRLIPDTTVDPKKVTRVVLCSGKVYYDLLEARGDNASVALVRFEQLYPMPIEELQAELARYSKKVELVWAQEEPRNMGAWTIIDETLPEVLGREIPYAGRLRSASPATGSPKKHKAQLEALLAEAIGGDRGQR
jgi:2-oxoglutarate dehydrogenase E1 component